VKAYSDTELMGVRGYTTMSILRQRQTVWDLDGESPINHSIFSEESIKLKPLVLFAVLAALAVAP